MSAPDTGSGDVVIVELDRPECGNAIDLISARRLRYRLADIAAADEIGAVVLAGRGRDFCVGGDLRDFAHAPAPADYIRDLADVVHQAITVMRSLPMPVIAAVHGNCAGAGLGLALAADLVVAEPTTIFRSAYIGVGLSPDCGVSWGLPRAVGAARACDMLLTNSPLGGIEARDLGLVSRVVDTGSARAVALDLASALACGPRIVAGHTVRLVRRAGDSSLAAQLSVEATLIADALASPEGSEGVAAFLTKRRPDFPAARMHRTSDHNPIDPEECE
ncbi:enoyl-CoA hydratase/isomerase family protein [Nocardia sp. NPDC049526]|uniref:enoyl-CoA hydratase/isomerase family protein n=1 Tax=Nocardia sp. NPDC049526 TaxID=3364316 RepID=UPI0037B36C8B